MVGMLLEGLHPDDPMPGITLKQIRADVATSLAGPIAERIFWYRNGVNDDLLTELPEPKEYANWVFEAKSDFDPDEPWPDIPSACRLLCQLPDSPRLRLEAQRVSQLLRYPRTCLAVEALALPLKRKGFLSMDEANAILEKATPPTDFIFRGQSR